MPCTPFAPKMPAIGKHVCAKRHFQPPESKDGAFRNPNHQEEEHYSHRSNWLRAAVLGANDGLVSVASIMLGVGAASQDQHTLLLSGLSALVAGEGAPSACMTRCTCENQLRRLPLAREFLSTCPTAGVPACQQCHARRGVCMSPPPLQTLLDLGELDHALTMWGMYI